MELIEGCVSEATAQLERHAVGHSDPLRSGAVLRGLWLCARFLPCGAWANVGEAGARACVCVCVCVRVHAHVWVMFLLNYLCLVYYSLPLRSCL